MATAAEAEATSGIQPLKTTTTPNAVSNSTNISEHTAMTTPLHDETDPTQTVAASVTAAAVVTPSKEEEEKKATKTATSTTNNGIKHPNSKLVLGEWIAEGGFCSIYEVTTIQDLDTQEYLWGAPPPSSSRTQSEPAEGAKRGHRSRRTMSISSFTSSLGQKPHKRGQSTSALLIPQGTHLPPLMKSVEMTVVRSFQDVDFKAHDGYTSTENEGEGFAPKSKMGGSARTQARRSVVASFRRSTNTEGAHSFLKQSISKSKVDPSALVSNSNTSASASPNLHYVLKCLKNPVLQNLEVLELGLKDMNIEIQMLQRLRHPNIIGLRAHGTMVLDPADQQNHPLSAAESKQKVLERINNRNANRVAPTAYPFLILDRLGETLEDKFRYWEAKNKQKSTLVGKLVTHRSHDKHTLYGRERWQTLCDMASALSYLHKRRIIYRDIKPENVAFDRYTGTLKLLDFGLAKDLAPLKCDARGLFLLTGLTGSARYMAPEVAREDAYNEKCDVYGLAIVMWQVMALETPYAKFTVNKMFKFVYDCPHVRPSLEEWRSKSSIMDEDDTPMNELIDNLEWFARLLSDMWSPLIEERPSMKEVHSLLQQKLDQAVVEQTKAASLH